MFLLERWQVERLRDALDESGRPEGGRFERQRAFFGLLETLDVGGGADSETYREAGILD